MLQRLLRDGPAEPEVSECVSGYATGQSGDGQGFGGWVGYPVRTVFSYLVIRVISRRG